MIIYDKALIKYFGTNNLNEKSLQKVNNVILLSSEVNVIELVNIINTFPQKFNEVSIDSANPDFISSVVRNMPNNIIIGLNKINKITFEKIPLDVSARIRRIFFNENNQYNETISIDDILEKYPNAIDIRYPFLLRKDTNGIPGNISDIDRIIDLMTKTYKMYLSPELLEEFKDFYKDDLSYFNIAIGSNTIYNKNAYENWSQHSEEENYCLGCELNSETDFLKYTAEGKETIFYIKNMSDISLEIAEKLKENGVNCKIRVESYDNSSWQNEDYNLDEYIEMSRVMNDLINDIDDNLPEDIKFQQIYERVTKFIVYDYSAAYPKNKQEKEYSKENIRNCRNLKNGLLEGKAVCAGYADILKNACLLKGIECEYIQGPIDVLESKEDYFYQKKTDRKNKNLMYIDDDYVITREYHAWNKVKINGIWYNVDPTWDRNDIINGKVPKYALISDENYKKLGRPTVKVFRHPCTEDYKYSQKLKLFENLESSEYLIASNKIIEFEESVNEYGMPKELPVVPKIVPWYRLMIKAKKLFYEISKKMKNGFYKTIYNISRKKDSDQTEPVETVAPTEPLETVSPTEPLETVSPTEPLKTINNNPIKKEEKIPSWQLSKEEVIKVNKAIARKTNNELNNEKDNEQIQNDDILNL